MSNEDFSKLMTAEQVEDMKQKTAEALESGTAMLKFQTRDPFEDFLEQIDQDSERREATPEEVVQMDANLKKLGQLFEGTDVSWHLDGALNISLLKGEYIGIHKDVDISIEADELEQLMIALEKKKYGLFLSHLENPDNPKSKHIMERVGAKAIMEKGKGELMLAAIDTVGKIREEEALNFIDVHLVARNEAGEPRGYGETTLPQEWFVDQSVEYKGETINISHPAKVAFFKLHQTRNYDQTDLEKLVETGSITMADVDQIERSFEEEFIDKRKRGEELLLPIFDQVRDDMDATQVFKLFEEESVIASQMKSIRPQVEELSRFIVSEHSADEVLKKAFELFGVEKQKSEQQSKIQAFRKMVESQKQLEIAREQLS